MAYEFDNHCITRSGKEGKEQLTNFLPRIDKQLMYHDGDKTTTHLELTGTMAEDEDEVIELPRIRIPATEFASLTWVAEKWGMEPIIFPVSGAERDIRTAIQLLSKPSKEHIYTHTGWTKLDDSPAYLSTSGAIRPTGLDPAVRVELPSELSRYSLPAPQGNQTAFRASIALAQRTGPKPIMWPLVLAAFRAAWGPCDFALHLSGRTGTFKSEITSLIQSHFGREMDARHLPGSWSSTVNATEHLAYRAKDAIFVLDDYVPVGTSYQVRGLQAAADRLFRAQGNQAGRSRLTDVSSMQTTFYPRGLILSTGEDIPEGHSMRGRMLILELTPGDIDAERLTFAQANRNMYPVAMADWINWIAQNRTQTGGGYNMKKMANDIRDNHLGIGHSRTPAIIGELCATANIICIYAAEQGWLTDDEADQMADEATTAVVQAAEKMTPLIEATDPVNAFLDTLRSLLTSRMAHAATRTGGVPIDAERYGWTKDEQPGQMPSYKPNGPCVGWVDPQHKEFLFDPNLIATIKKHSSGRLSITPQTLAKRIKESGMLTRTDDVRQRNTVRVTIEGHARQVLALRLSDVHED